MTLSEIITAVLNGDRVYWSNEGYRVIGHGCDPLDYYIVCQSNNNTIGLTWMDGRTLNGKEEQFFRGE